MKRYRVNYLDKGSDQLQSQIILGWSKPKAKATFIEENPEKTIIDIDKQ